MPVVVGNEVGVVLKLNAGMTSCAHINVATAEGCQSRLRIRNGSVNRHVREAVRRYESKHVDARDLDLYAYVWSPA